MFTGSRKQRLMPNFTPKRTLTAQNEHYRREFELASRMQRKLFFSQESPDVRVSMLFRYLPLDSLGGDMFGCLPQKDGRLCFYIADVSGSGICAAVVTLYITNILRSMSFSSPAQALCTVRDAFNALNDDDRLYVTMFFLILDPNTGELVWANAGLSTVPIMICGDELTRLYAPGLPLCNWDSEAQYHDNKLIMGEGARLLLYTDGLIDTKSTNLTEEDIETRILGMEGGALLNSLEGEVLEGRSDDVCALLITRLA